MTCYVSRLAMSRTKRTKRPKMKLGTLAERQYKDGTLRDGTPTHASAACARHGGCPYCESNREHSNRKREPIVET